MTHDEIQHIASEAAKQAVRELLVAMGVNANDPEALLKMQADFRHLRTWRESADTVRKQGLKTAVGILVSGFLAAIYATYFKGWPFH